MNHLILRYRDLTIPQGETIRRHTYVIEEMGYVWWGWIKRNHEVLPVKEFKEISRNIRDSGGSLDIYLYNSGLENILEAKLSAIYAVPGDVCSSPEPQATPDYMSEAILPAWFKITHIEKDREITNGNVYIQRFPTIHHSSKKIYNLRELRDTDCTLWIGLLQE